MTSKNVTFNTAENRAAMLKRAADWWQHEMAKMRGLPAEQAQAYEQMCLELDAINLLALPELEILDWSTSVFLYGSMWPNSGIYLEPHKHRHAICNHVTECPWPHKVTMTIDDSTIVGKQPCQAIEHWDGRCDSCDTIWWEKFGKAEAEEYQKNNPPKWIHDHGKDEGPSLVRCLVVGCRNYDKVYNGHELWNGREG